MAERGAELARQIEARIAELESTLAPLDDGVWQLRCEAEDWPLGFVAYHISVGLQRQAGWLERRAHGGPPASFDWEGTHALNAALFRRHGLPAKPTVLQALRRRLARITSIARSLSDEQLDRMTFRSGEHQRSAEWILRSLALRHIDDHVRSIRATVSAHA